MKNTLYFIFGIFLLSSCQDYLDVQPVEKVIPETIEHFDQILKDRNGHILRGYHIYMDDDISMPTKFSTLPAAYENAYYWNEYIIEGEGKDAAYQTIYLSILYANTVLDHIDDAEGDDEEYRQEVIGKALISRAVAYHYLVNLYAKHYNPESASADLGVPLILKPDIEDKSPRATVEQVYDQIITDLLEGVELVKGMSPNFPMHNYEPSKAVAYAYLSRVYLYMGNWEKTIEFGEKALAIHNDLNDYNVVDERPAYRKYPNANKEVLLRRLNTTISTLLYNAHLSDDLLIRFDTDKDLRIKVFTSSTASGLSYFTGVKAYSYMILSGIQTPEIILNTAEAYARLGNKEKAMENINYLRNHRFDKTSFADDAEFNTYVNLVATDNADALNKVLEERRRELMFTGLRWQDMKRLIVLGEFNKTVVRDHGEEFHAELAPNSPRYVLPIPLREIDLNPNLEQNPR